MGVCFKAKRFGPAAARQIEQALDIIAEYTQAGFKLTLRQLYYQFVARGFLPNTERSYKMLGGVINDARLAGLIPFAVIEDRTRERQSQSHWSKPSDILQSAVNSFRLDMWESQKERVEVWIEKEALVGVIADVCKRWDVPFMACRGYVSQSAMWEAGSEFYQRRWGGAVDDEHPSGQRTVILYLGDHDPSGLDMTRDIEDRLAMFAPGVCDVIRLGLSMDQVDTYNPPPNPAKVTDSR